MLRPDPEVDFLATSLPDAIALSLAGIRSLVVRSTVTTAKYAEGPPDLTAIASTLDVGAVLSGTILPAGDRCRVVAQLIEAPSGQVLWSLTSDVSGRDAFELQDALTRKIVDALHVPLTTRERGSLAKDTPASATAYELFRRQTSAVFDRLTLAIVSMQSIEVDPDYAPAWARLGRAQRIHGKYNPHGREEAYRKATEALDKAMEINPDHPGAHHMKALLDLDLGRAEEAVERLLGVVARNPNDPEGYAGLVSAFRYIGMLEPALEADRRAKALALDIRTSVNQVYYALGDYDARSARRPRCPGERRRGVPRSGRAIGRRVDAGRLAAFPPGRSSAAGRARWARSADFWNASVLDDSTFPIRSQYYGYPSRTSASIATGLLRPVGQGCATCRCVHRRREDQEHPLPRGPGAPGQ
jgi:adenylate cyclase